MYVSKPFVENDDIQSQLNHHHKIDQKVLEIWGILRVYFGNKIDEKLYLLLKIWVYHVHKGNIWDHIWQNYH